MDPAAFPPIITALTLLYAVSKGSREWTNWKRERRELKRSEVAAQVLVATLRFLSGLRAVTSSVIGQTPSPTESSVTPESDSRVFRSAWDRQMHDLLEDQNRKWQSFHPAAQDFVTAWELAEVFLPAEVDAFLQQLWEKKASVFANQNGYMNAIRQAGAASSFFEKAFGPAVQGEIDKLREEACRMLRPMAQLQDAP